MTQAFLMMRGSSGGLVQPLKIELAAQLGGDAAMFPGLAKLAANADDETFDADTEAALRRWQSGRGLIADGIAGAHCCTLLKLRGEVQLEINPDLASVQAVFPQTKPSNIVRYLPYVTDALQAAGLTDRPMILAALGTIRAETAGFVPIPEYASHFNTLPGRPPFSAYDPDTTIGKNLGNTQPGDGARYRGRGFVQLTGSDNYHHYTIATGIDLAAQPDLACAPEVAAALLAMFLADHAKDMRDDLAAARYLAARKLVNGGSHGVDDFKSVFLLAPRVWPSGAVAVASRSPTVKALLRAAKLPSADKHPRVTRKDPPDLRDRLYQPAPVTLPDVYPPDDAVSAKLGDYRHLVLDQGRDSSCTGYGLACVINYARWQKSNYDPKLTSVSARMLYNYARRYDEYAGENYEGSSCRGALRGWHNNGVCMWNDWPDQGRPAYGFADRAKDVTLGVYYRIDTKSITDLQAAILQAHAIYVSAFTHEGWDRLHLDAPSKEVPTHENLPHIEFDGRPSTTGGHAFALVGFNVRGFIVQNSWGAEFGIGGFAILTYEDWLANAMDAWVASLGVPGVVGGMMTQRAAMAAGAAGFSFGPRPKTWWSEELAYEHSIVMGNDGRATRYLPEDAPSRALQHQACGLVDQWFRTDDVAKQSAKKRLVIYAHGGLNSESDAIDRARAMGRFFAGNGCYPLFLVWKTGLCESLIDLFQDKFRGPQQAGRAGAVSALTDRFIEQTLGRGPGRQIWSEMKDNAQFSCATSRACDQLAVALQSLASTWGANLEIHLIGHSAGSIILGWFLGLLSSREYKAEDGTITKLAANLKSAHLYAPACTVQFANQHWAPHRDVMEHLWLHILSDRQEQDDDTAAIYRKSLLYLISNALEPDERTPVLGMERVLDTQDAGWDGSSTTNEALTNWRAALEDAKVQKEGRLHIVRETQVPDWQPKDGDAHTIFAGHGSFDNNLDVINATIGRIIDNPKLSMPVDDLRNF